MLISRESIKFMHIKSLPLKKKEEGKHEMKTNLKLWTLSATVEP